MKLTYQQIIAVVQGVAHGTNHWERSSPEEFRAV